MWICEVFNLIFIGIVAFVTLADYIDRKKKDKRRPPDQE